MRHISIAILLFLSVSILITAQIQTDPAPQCTVIGRGSEGLTGEIKCREKALSATSGKGTQIPAMLFKLAETYQTLGESKAEDYYKRLVADYCKNSPDLCAEAQKRLSALQTKNNVPRRIDTPFTSDPYSFAISPDGQKLVYLATVSGKTALWLHDLNSGKTAPISGTESNGYGPTIGGAHPFWSPDNKAIGFFVDGKLKRIDVAGGAPETIADAPANYGGSWNRDDVIIFVRENLNAVYRVPATGGVPQRITELNAATVSQRFPQFLSDDHRFIFYQVDLRNAPESPLVIGSLDSSQTKALNSSVHVVQAAQFVPSDQLLVVGQRTLFAQHLDPVTFELTGARDVVAEQVADFRGTATPGYAAVSVSRTGSIAYRAKDTASSQLVWLDREGRQTGRLGQLGESATISHPRFSSDGRAVAVVMARSDGAYVRLIETKTGNTRDLFVADIARFRWDTLAWSPDGESFFIAMTVPGFGNTDIYRRTISGTALERFTNINGNESVPSDTSSDGEYLLYTFAVGTPNMSNLRARRMSDGVTSTIAQSVRSGSGKFSPDARWIAYEDAGAAANADQIWVQAFPGNGRVSPRISVKGHDPQWSRDGKELYFVLGDNQLMAMPVKLLDGGKDLSTSDATPLFTLPEGSSYTPAEGGFLVNTPVEAAPPIYVLSDWNRSIPAAPASVLTSDTRAVENVNSRQVVVLDRRGNTTARIGVPYSGASGSVALSPDGTQIATIRNGELSVTDIATNARKLVALDAIQVPAWSGDGHRLAYLSDRAADPGIYFRASNGEGTEQSIYRGVGTGKATNLWNWTAEGRYLAAAIADRITVLSTTGGDAIRRVVTPAAGKTGLRFSPRGDFLAYISNDETAPNQMQVWIRSFDPNDVNGYIQRQIANGAVGMIRWRGDGDELYYLDSRGMVMAVPITTSPQLRAGRPVPLFQTPPGFVVDPSVSDSLADVSADGQRFVFIVATETRSRN